MKIIREFPGSVSAVVVGVACDSTGFVYFPVISKGREHDATDSFDSVAALDPPIIVD